MYVGLEGARTYTTAVCSIKSANDVCRTRIAWLALRWEIEVGVN